MSSLVNISLIYLAVHVCAVILFAVFPAQAAFASMEGTARKPPAPFKASTVGQRQTVAGNNISRNSTQQKLAQNSSAEGQVKLKPPLVTAGESKNPRETSGQEPKSEPETKKSNGEDNLHLKLRSPIPASSGTAAAQNQPGKEQETSGTTRKPRNMGVIRFDVDRSKPPMTRLAGGISIFRALDEALVKSPRAAAIRAYLPITKAMLARATEQPSVSVFYEFAVRAEQTKRLGPVFNWEPPWKLIFRLLVAKRSVDQRKLELMADLWRLRADVRRIYTEVVVAQETLETLTSLFDLAHRLRVVSEKRFQAGDVPELDLLKARLAESRYDVERRVGSRRVIRAKQMLNIIMGRPPERPINVPRLPPFLKSKGMLSALTVRNPLLPDFSKPMLPLQHFIDMAIRHRYELKSVNQAISVNKASMKNAIGNIFPNPEFWIGQSIAGNPPEGPRLTAYYFGVNVPTRITNFNQGDIAKVKAEGRQLRYQLGSQKNVITSEVSSAYNNVLAARQWLKVYEDHVLADSYEVARLARRSYEVGQSDITSTLQAQQNNVQIRSLYLQAISLYQKAFTELEMACGTPLLAEY